MVFYAGFDKTVKKRSLNSMLNFKDSFSIAVSSTAPFYSIMVTAPLIISLVGGGAPFIYLISAIPSILVCLSMQKLDNLIPSKGTVYSWNENHFLSWISGYCLAATGIICTAGLSIFAADAIVGENFNFRDSIVVLVSSILLVSCCIVNIKSIKIITVVQSIGILIQLTGMIYILFQIAQQGNYTEPISGSFSDWIHAIILSIFAYWGFDAVFALTEESEKDVSQKTSIISIVSLIAFFMILTYGLTVADIDTHNTLISISIVASSITAIGSTAIPTIRGVEAMAENNDMPGFLSSRKNASIIVLSLSILWSILAALFDGFFWDSIESVSIMVGIYFSLSCYAAYKKDKNKTHLVGLIIMIMITIIVLFTMFSTDYGETSVYGVGGVGIIVVVLLTLGLLFFAIIKHAKSQEQQPTVNN